tara:strand:+ start:2637 stop:3920 length:1284 start_codon:yes stop_codon:yes gene_type:complete
MIFLYKTLTNICYPLFIIFIYYRKILKKEDPLRYKEKILFSHFKVNRENNSKLIWFHAASIGELKSIIPIINELNKRYKKTEFLITTITLSSSNLAREQLKDIKNSHHRFLPLDVNFLIKKFIKLWKPDKIFLVDSEIWPNLILEAQRRRIPIALINARLTSKSFNKWMLFPNIAKKIFGVFDLCMCSNIETKKFLNRLNAKNIHFKGNIKFIDTINSVKIKDVNEDYLRRRRFWFAASTHNDEDIFCIKTHLKLKEKFSDIITIIAPRHIERVTKIKSLSEKFKLNVQILNKNENILKGKDIIIINFFGVLQNYYKYAKSVFIGKSMIKKLRNEGGQNPLEAAKLKCKVYHGPYVYNFEEIYKILEKNKISKKIENYQELSDNLTKDLIDPYKQNNEISDIINNLGKETLIDTMKLIDIFFYKNDK